MAGVENFPASVVPVLTAADTAIQNRDAGPPHGDPVANSESTRKQRGRLSEAHRDP
ncbi:MAG TPA: hypothetical protein VK307_10070 [Thermoleophilaceae bacterium]|nr:hypothetical protein [Thermoleophilaceae bacterium]